MSDLLIHTQRDSLKILDRLCQLLPPQNIPDLKTSLGAVQAEFPTVTDFVWR
ncbi:MAG: hypothetical protein VKN60_07740 [Cyanobacteriota bacterium]|nr:hypothetical protein [Cyanobacteriota bacterium]